MNLHHVRQVLGLFMAIALSGTGFGSEAQEYVGRWNIKIEDTGDTFSTAWLRVDRDDQGLSGSLVWKWGSVTPVQEVVVDESGLHFKRGRERFVARIEEDQLRGVATMRNGDRFEFIGWHAQEMCDVTGNWEVVPTSRTDAKPGTFRFHQEDGKISGEAIDPQGHAYAIEDAHIEGRELSFKARPIVNDAPPRTVVVEIRGDRLVGQVTVPESDQREAVKLPIKGRRLREWDEPVSLLHHDHVDGWGPRDSQKKFGWTVKEGVLENSPPDVDIISDAQFRDFHLHLEYKVDPKSNSGVYLRGRYELQILGDTRVQDHGNLAVYSRLKPNKNPLKLGEWNDLDVTFIGRWLTVVLNGETVHDNQYLDGPTGGAWDPREEEPGPLLLQGDHGKVSYRNIVVRRAKNN